MKHCKRCACVLFSALIVLLSVPFSFGTEALLDEGSCGETLRWALSETGVLRIWGTGEMEDVPWLDYADEIYAVVLEPGVTSVCAGAFTACTVLETVDIAASVTSIVPDALEDCPALTAIRVDPENPCFSCDAAGALFNKEKTELLRYPGGRSQGSYTLPDTVISIAPRAFEPAPGLQSLVLPQGLQRLGADALKGCFRLTALEVPDSVEALGPNAIADCVSLQSLQLGSGVSSIDPTALPRFSDLTILTVSEENAAFSAQDNMLFDKAKTTLLFYPAALPATVCTVPDGVTTIDAAAFSDNCTLTKLVLPASLTEIGRTAFARCYALTELCSAGMQTASAASGFLRFVPAEGYDAATLRALYALVRRWEKRDVLLLEDSVLFDRLSAVTGEEISDFEDFDRLRELALTQAEPTDTPQGLTFHAYAASAEADYCAGHGLPLQLHDVSVSVRRTEPTCETDGAAVLRCATCPLTETRILPALGHDFDDWTDNGETHIRTCFRCGEEEEAAHVWDDGEIVSTATCKTPGNVKYNCTLCVATKTEQTALDSSNHADYGTHLANAVAAGCTEPGYTGDRVCNGCGAVLEEGEEISALGHDFDDWTDNGETHIRTCFRCGEEEEAAHVWDGGETVSTATCKTPGSVKYNCTLCVATKTEQTEKNPANHADYGTHLANAVAAGCTEPGYTGNTVCDGCGAVLEAGEELSALGHDFDDWTDNGETHIRTCFRCGEEEEAAHVWDDGETVSTATCKTPGNVKYNCTLCVATKTEQTALDSSNHADYGTHIANAVTAGCTEPGYTGDTVCDGCGAVLEAGEELAALGHDFR